MVSSEKRINFYTVFSAALVPNVYDLQKLINLETVIYCLHKS